MSSSQAKLTLRAPPHRQFITGWPGIPAGQGRPAAHIAGEVEVRLGGKGLKASWLRIELRKLEMTPSGENWGELIGKGPIEVWKAEGNAETDAEGRWDLIQTEDFPFKILIPEGLPPTARLDKQIGISYEMVTSLCVKAKKGLLRKEDTSSIIQSTHPISIEKHELHSTWPIYSVADDHELMANQVIARVYRKQTCFGPGDKAEIRVILTSKNVSPVKIKSIAFSIRETVTFKGNKRQSRMMGGATKTGNQRTDSIVQKAQSLGIKLYKGDVKTYDIALTIPKTHSLMTIQTAKHIEVAYTMRVYVDTKQPIIIDHLPMTITNVPRATSATVVPEIGFVPGLSAPISSKQSQSYGESIQRPMSAGAGGSAPRRTPTQSTGSTVKPGPQRSLSFLSSAPSHRSGDSGYGYGGPSAANLGRRDTMMTTASGPGMAGRGVPGQIFSWQQQGDQVFTTAFGQAHSGPKPAFAGPASIYEGRELAPEENRALFHHSFSTPLGQVFEGQEAVPAVNYDFHHQQEGGAGYPRTGGTSSAASSSQHLRPSRQSHDAEEDVRPVRPASSGPQSHDAAEAEKERLYQRARQQAEKNQRRAAEALAAAAAGRSAGTPTGHRTVSSPTSPTTLSNEKQVLYERARREAERYQAGYVQGATFPQDDFSSPEEVPSPGGSGNGSSSSNVATSSAVASQSSGAKPQRHSQQVTSFPSAAEEKARLYEAAKAERDAHLAGSARRSPAQASPAVGSSSSQARPQSASVYPSVHEEKQRFAAAQAERDAFLRAQQGAGGLSSSSSASAAPPPPASSNGHANSSHGFPSAEDEKRRLYDKAKAEADAAQRQSPPSFSSAAAPSASASRGSMPPGSSFPSAEEEKRRLYEQAKAEVDAHQSVGGTMMSASASNSSAASSLASPSVASAAAPMTPAVMSAEDEKTQLKRYYEAQDAVAQRMAEQQSLMDHGSSSSSAAAPPPLARPAASYASGYFNGGPSQATPPIAASSAGRSPVPASPSHHNTSFDNTHDLDDSSSVISIPYRSASVLAGKQRSAPSPTSSPPPPTLPTFSFSSLQSSLPQSNGGAVSGGSNGFGSFSTLGQPGPPTPGSARSSIYAPKMAPIDWHEEEEYEDRRSATGSAAGGGGAAPPPPLPPKTPLSPAGGTMPGGFR